MGAFYVDLSRHVLRRNIASVSDHRHFPPVAPRYRVHDQLFPLNFVTEVRAMRRGGK